MYKLEVIARSGLARIDMLAVQRKGGRGFVGWQKKGKKSRAEKKLAAKSFLFVQLISTPTYR